MSAFPIFALGTLGSWILLAVVLFLLLSILLALVGLYQVVSLPLNRQERARFFLDLVDTGLKSGQSAEQTVVGISKSRERDVGVHFHLLAAHIESGLRMDQALEKVPRLLPPQIQKMLKAGTRLANISNVLPACRRLLKDGLSQTRGALNYLLLVMIFILPVMPLLFLLIQTYIMPQYQAIFQEMTDTEFASHALVVQWSSWFAWLQLMMMGLLLILVAGFIGGPGLRRWSQGSMRSFVDHIFARLPWRRWRLQRDFTGMLALLLDAEVPEKEALILAAECTDNLTFTQAAATAVHHLEQGTPLPRAVQYMHCAPELPWRLENAARVQTGFRAALAGWLEALDAKAFQQEQAAAQLLTTGVVLINGVMVGSLVIGLFSMLILIINQTALW